MIIDDNDNDGDEDEAKKIVCLFASHTNLKMGVGGRAEGFFFYCSNTVLTNGFNNGGWKIRCAVHSDIVHNV